MSIYYPPTTFCLLQKTKVSDKNPTRGKDSCKYARCIVVANMIHSWYPTSQTRRVSSKVCKLPPKLEWSRAATCTSSSSYSPSTARFLKSSSCPIFVPRRSPPTGPKCLTLNSRQKCLSKAGVPLSTCLSTLIVVSDANATFRAEAMSPEAANGSSGGQSIVREEKPEAEDRLGKNVKNGISDDLTVNVQ